MPADPPSEFPESSTEPPRRPQFADFSFKPESCKRRKRRPRHSLGQAEHSIWQFGAGIIPPLALVGLTLAVLGFIRGEILNSPIMQLSVAAICGVTVLGLGTILYGINSSSRRLERKEVWLALLLGVITLLALGSLMMKGRIVRLFSHSTVHQQD